MKNNEEKTLEEKNKEVRMYSPTFYVDWLIITGQIDIFGRKIKKNKTVR